MKHIRGIEVYLTDRYNVPSEEKQCPWNTAGLQRFNGFVGSRSIYAQPGTAFKVRIKFDSNFRIYGAKGVKIVVVADSVHPESGRVMQRHRLWWVDVDRLRPGAEYTLEGFQPAETTPGENAAEKFLVPEPDANYKNATNNWVIQDYYCANKGCIAVFIERGKLRTNLSGSAEIDTDSSMAHPRSKVKEPIRIRPEWFLALNGENGNPYVFEFRNIGSDDFISATSNSKGEEFGWDVHDVTFWDSLDSPCSSEDEDESESESEPEAEATDSDSDESLSDSPESEDTDYGSSIGASRKRPRMDSEKHTPRKKRDTTCEKNAEADATNATFANQRKNAQANATNATFANSDRDDEEVLPPDWWAKRAIKQEARMSPSTVNYLSHRQQRAHGQRACQPCDTASSIACRKHQSRERGRQQGRRDS